jgi:hypothetical protein
LPCFKQDIAAGAAADSISASLSTDDFCRVMLSSSCSKQLSELSGTRVELAFGSRVAYAKSTQGLLADTKVGSL